MAETFASMEARLSAPGMEAELAELHAFKELIPTGVFTVFATVKTGIIDPIVKVITDFKAIMTAFTEAKRSIEEAYVKDRATAINPQAQRTCGPFP